MMDGLHELDVFASLKTKSKSGHLNVTQLTLIKEFLNCQTLTDFIGYQVRVGLALYESIRFLTRRVRIGIECS